MDLEFHQLDLRYEGLRVRRPDRERRLLASLAEHRPARGEGIKRTDPRPEEKTLGQLVPEIASYVTALKKRSRKYITVALRQMLRMAREYPRDAFLAAVAQAAHYGLYDLDRLERMILRRIASHYFQLDNKDH